MPLRRFFPSTEGHSLHRTPLFFTSPLSSRSFFLGTGDPSPDPFRFFSLLGKKRLPVLSTRHRPLLLTVCLSSSTVPALFFYQRRKKKRAEADHSQPTSRKTTRVFFRCSLFVDVPAPASEVPIVSPTRRVATRLEKIAPYSSVVVPFTSFLLCLLLSRAFPLKGHGILAASPDGHASLTYACSPVLLISKQE